MKTPRRKRKKTRRREPLELDLKEIEDRTTRLTLGSAEVLDWSLTPDGETLVYLIKTEDGFALWQNKLRDKETKRLAEFPKEKSPNARGEDFPARLMLNKEGDTAFVLAGGHISKVNLKDAKSELVKFNAEMTLDRAAERAYLFEHVWRQMAEKYYATDLHGVDWNYYKSVYEKFLPSINNNYDFAELLSEMLGEINAIAHRQRLRVPSSRRRRYGGTGRVLRRELPWPRLEGAGDHRERSFGDRQIKDRTGHDHREAGRPSHRSGCRPGVRCSTVRQVSPRSFPCSTRRRTRVSMRR